MKDPDEQTGEETEGGREELPSLYFLVCCRIPPKAVKTGLSCEISAKFLRPTVFHPSIYSKPAVNILP